MKILRYLRPMRTPNDTKAGVALVLFAVLVFAMLGIAALTVDLGFASLGQAQMQAAADTAALEGVRRRDYDVYRPVSNLHRRLIVSELVREVLDDDLHPTGGIAFSDPYRGALPADDSDGQRFGAGPVMRLEGGIGEANASALIVIPDESTANASERWIDDPELQSNTRNAACGDIVSGSFNSQTQHAEDETYERADFTPALPTGFNNSGSWNALGMLVRLRRTSGDNPLDHVDSISSRGATLPFLFGMGTSIHAAGPGYNPRTEGLTLRAVAIASARPALRIGPPPRKADGSPVLNQRREDGNEPVFGVGYWHVNASGEREWFSIAFSFETFWGELVGSATCAADTGVTGRYWNFTTDAGGALHAAHQEANEPEDGLEEGVTVGQLMHDGGTIGDFAPTDLTTGPNPMTASEVAQVFAEIRALAGSPGQLLYAYFPIYRTIVGASGTSSQRVIGFGYGSLSFPMANQLRFTFKFDTRDDDPPPILVAPDNASATITRGSLPIGMSQAEWDVVFSYARNFTYPMTPLPIPNPPPPLSGRWQDVRIGSVLAPALVR
ncbi:MAG: Tad domain-containing protein [Planctomycetes bacterium]|nr:Tad domain-containing protein [Planctomycetota bacterium]